MLVDPPSVVVQGVALVENVVAPPLVVAQVVAFVGDMVVLQASPLEVCGVQRLLAVWVTGLIFYCAFGVGWVFMLG